MAQILNPILSILVFICLINNIDAQDFKKTFDLAVGSSITNTQFKFKTEYLHKPQESIYGRIGLRNRRVADEVIGLDTFFISSDTMNMRTFNRYSYRDGNELLLNVGYRLYSGNYFTTNKYNHSQFYIDMGASFYLRLYEESILPDNLSNYGVVLGGGYKFYLDKYFSIDFSFNTETRTGKWTDSTYIDIEGNIELGVGYILGGRQKLSVE